MGKEIREIDLTFGYLKWMMTLEPIKETLQTSVDCREEWDGFKECDITRYEKPMGIWRVALVPFLKPRVP